MKYKVLDVRPLLESGTEPLSKIRETVDSLEPGTGLTVIAPFLPAPLIEMLRGEGFTARAEHRRDGGWEVHFSR